MKAPGWLLGSAPRNPRKPFTEPLMSELHYMLENEPGMIEIADTARILADLHQRLKALEARS